MDVGETSVCIIALIFVGFLFPEMNTSIAGIDPVNPLKPLFITLPYVLISTILYFFLRGVSKK